MLCIFNVITKIRDVYAIYQRQPTEELSRSIVEEMHFRRYTKFENISQYHMNVSYLQGVCQHANKRYLAVCAFISH